MAVKRAHLSSRCPEAGDIFWFKPPDPQGEEEQGNHPWVVLSEQDDNHREGTFIAAPMTRTAIGHSEFCHPLDSANMNWFPAAQADKVEGAGKVDPAASHGICNVHRLRHFDTATPRAWIGQVQSREWIHEARRVASRAIGDRGAVRRRGRR